MSDLIRTQHQGPVFEIILNRPDKRNALSLETMLGLEAAVQQAEQAQGVRAILLRGAGASFSSGIDLMGWDQMIEQFGEHYRQNLFPMTYKLQGILTMLERCTLPVIALLHGHCIGMGFELALACDIRIAAQDVKIGLPESRLGLIPDVGGTTRLTRLIGPGRAKELIMTGRLIDAAQAERWGLVNHVVGADELAAKGQALVEEITQAAPLAVSYAKRVVDAVADLDRGMQFEAWAQSILIRTQDFENGAAAMLTKQPVEWLGK
jgi:enoyl-CoA hydratase/carnithine racemase